MKKQDDIDPEKFAAAEVSKWLVDLASDNEQIRNTAYVNLVGSLTPWPAFDTSFGTPDEFKSGLRNDIPLLAIPSLIELLSNEKVQRKSDIIELLHNLGCYIFASQVYTRANNPEDDIYRTRAKRIRDAVFAGIPIYRSFLDLPDSADNSEAMNIKIGAKDILRILKSENLTEI